MLIDGEANISEYISRVDNYYNSIQRKCNDISTEKRDLKESLSRNMDRMFALIQELNAGAGPVSGGGQAKKLI